MDRWDWGFALDILPDLLRGLLITFVATVLGSVLAYSLGLVFALLLRTGFAPLTVVVRGFIEFVRSTPLLVQLYFLFFVLPQTFGITLGSLTVGVIGLGVHYSTYTAEVYRAGIDAVPRGQWEAALALNLPQRRTWTGVILPQAIPRVLPALGNYTISMFKETPLLLAIGVLELVGAAQQAGGNAFRYLEAYTLAGLFFLLLSYPSGLLLRRLERRVGLAS
ncbi:MAG TPA: ectoine/hydroxyectoine ABC transporter permease subunit EhuD [Pseudonocardiaceae bacterium]|jgi:polar amino acid transport system permease protein|nr:ectoine/hydroxyectoine ABC transporter permease subunit EhuD [Pseudonocardiaceae bacterium]